MTKDITTRGGAGHDSGGHAMQRQTDGGPVKGGMGARVCRPVESVSVPPALVPSRLLNALRQGITGAIFCKVLID